MTNYKWISTFYKVSKMPVNYKNPLTARSAYVHCISEELPEKLLHLDKMRAGREGNSNHWVFSKLHWPRA